MLVMPRLSRTEVENICHALGRSLREFARAAKVDKSSFYKIIDGEQTPRDPEAWTRIDAIYEIWTREASAAKPDGAVIRYRLPVWPVAAANSWKSEPENDFFEVPDIVAKNERFALRVPSSNMAPRILAGDVLVFELSETIRSGRIGVVKDSDGLAHVRVVLRDGSGNETISAVNPLKTSPVGPVTYQAYLVAILRDWSNGRGFLEFDDGGLVP